MIRIVVAVCCMAGIALADDPDHPGIQQISIAVGDKVARNVGIAIGYQCDDPTLIDIEMKQASEKSNAFIVTGKKPGTTLCRVGLEPGRPSIVYDVRVTPKRR